MHRSKTESTYWKLSIIEFFICGSSMCFIAYLTVFLQSIGMSIEKIGIINALNAAIGIIGAFFWGIISDKLHSVKKAIIAAIIPSILLWSMIPMFSGSLLSAAMILIPVSAFFRVPPSTGLADNMVLQMAAKQQLKFSSIRLWGTIGFVLTGFLLTAVVPYLGVNATFYMYAGMATLGLVFMVFCLKADVYTEIRSQSLKNMQIGRLLKNYYYITYLVYLIIMFIPLSAGFTFFAFLLKEAGVSPDKIGLITASKSMIEIPMLFFMAKMKKWFSMRALLLSIGLFYFAQQMLYSTANSLIALIAISLIQGPSIAIYLDCGAEYIYRLAPDELKATAHMLGTSMPSLAGIIGSFIGGYIISALGIRQYYVVSGLIVLCSFILFLLSFPFGEKLLKKPLPQGIAKRVNRENCQQ